MINIAIKKSLNLFLTVLFTETIHRGVIKVVNKINKKLQDLKNKKHLSLKIPLIK